jgi:lysophospholipase L1-like esterase
LWRKLSPGSNTSSEWDFVGTEHNGPDDIDRDHEGHPGWTIENDEGISDRWIPLNPDVILLHLGTNNMGRALQQAPASLKHMENFLNLTFSKLPKVRLLLSTLIGSAVAYGGKQHVAYNAGLKEFVEDFKAKGFTIELVDMANESGIGTYCDDGYCCAGHIHPTAEGYDRMATVWHKHLTGKLPLFI